MKYLRRKSYHIFPRKIMLVPISVMIVSTHNKNRIKLVGPLFLINKCERICKCLRSKIFNNAIVCMYISVHDLSAFYAFLTNSCHSTDLFVNMIENLLKSKNVTDIKINMRLNVKNSFQTIN